MSSGSAPGGADRLTIFLGGKALSPFVSEQLLALMENPIKFRRPTGGPIVYGYPATVLADICDVVLSARQAGVLHRQQEHIADRCELLVRGFARIGIIALVDEATGFQRDRAKDALARIWRPLSRRSCALGFKRFLLNFIRNCTASREKSFLRIQVIGLAT